MAAFSGRLVDKNREKREECQKEEKKNGQCVAR